MCVLVYQGVHADVQVCIKCIMSGQVLHISAFCLVGLTIEPALLFLTVPLILVNLMGILPLSAMANHQLEIE